MPAEHVSASLRVPLPRRGRPRRRRRRQPYWHGGPSRFKFLVRGAPPRSARALRPSVDPRARPSGEPVATQALFRVQLLRNLRDTHEWYALSRVRVQIPGQQIPRGCGTWSVPAGRTAKAWPQKFEAPPPPPPSLSVSLALSLSSLSVSLPKLVAWNIGRRKSNDALTDTSMPERLVHCQALTSPASSSAWNLSFSMESPFFFQAQNSETCPSVRVLNNRGGGGGGGSDGADGVGA